MQTPRVAAAVLRHSSALSQVDYVSVDDLCCELICQLMTSIQRTAPWEAVGACRADLITIPAKALRCWRNYVLVSTN
jgi:hypothetical protein